MALTPEQQARRRGFVCGSDAGAVMAGAWRDLWLVKTGRAEPEDLSGNFQVALGTLTETLNLDWLERTTGNPVTQRGAWIESKEYPWLACHLDGVTLTPQGQPAYVDAKHVGRMGEQEVLRYTPQGVHCATVLDLDWWGLSPIVGNKWPGPIWQEADPLYRATYIARSREFWGYVERKEEPPETTAPVLAPKPRPKLRQIILDLTPEQERPNWAGDFIRLARRFADTEGAAKAHAITRDDMKNLVPDDVGLAQFGLVRFKRDARGVTIALDKMEGDDAGDVSR